MRYIAPKTAGEAAELLKNETGVSRILAGGSDILVQMKTGLVQPDLLVDIKRIDGIDDITPESGGFRIGATVSGARLGENEAVKKLWPGVVEAFELIGSTQVQGRATMAGNLCNASPAADSVPALVAAKAVVRIVGPKGERDCPVQDVPTGPGQNSLEKGEFVTSIFLPARPDNASDAYLRFIPRTEMDIAVVSAAVSLVLDGDGVVASANVALGAVAPTVLSVPDAGACLVGGRCDGDALQAMGEACSAAATPISDKRGTAEFRKDVVAVMAKRAATIAYTRAGGTS